MVSLPAEVELGLLLGRVSRAVLPWEHPPEEAQARATAPAVVGASAPHHARTLGQTVSQRHGKVETQGDANHAFHDSTSSS